MSKPAPFRNVLVTGATSGIGRACALWFARRGAAHVFFCGRDEARLAAVAREIRAAKRLAITSSMTGYHGMPQCPAYSASKAFAKAWGAALRGSLRAEGIVVTTICPGFVRSRITDENKCPMPFFLEAPAAADIIGRGIERGAGLVSFPWPMRLAMWWISSLPEILSERLFRLLPEKG